MRAKQREPSGDKYELRADGEALFRQAVHAAAKNGPKHRPPKPKPSVVKKKGQR
jgi:hypothetical protein